jgi:hypothetical protein
MKQLESYGTPAILVVPDSPIAWSQDLEGPLSVAQGRRAARRSGEGRAYLPVDADVANVDLDDSRVRLLAMPGTDEGTPRSSSSATEGPPSSSTMSSGTFHHEKGVRGFFWKLFGFTSEGPNTPSSSRRGRSRTQARSPRSSNAGRRSRISGA